MWVMRERDAGWFVYVCAFVNMHPTQVRYTGDHALAADEVPQTFVVVLFGHQVVKPIKCCLVLSTQ